MGRRDEAGPNPVRFRGRYVSKSFFYVYILQSETVPARHYTGFTEDLQARLARHNAGACEHTAAWRPWRLRTAVAFSDRQRALTFERYLKSHSGRAFTSKHF